MSPRILSPYRIGLMLVGLLSASPLAANTTGDPFLSKGLVQKIKKLPNGISGQPSLIIRSKHIQSVQFKGASEGSEKGFIRKNGVISDALWLRLKNSRSDNSANGKIIFSGTLDVQKYNSLLLWVRSKRAGQKIWLGIQDGQWTDSDSPQARTLVIPRGGLPRNQIVQVVIPFSRLPVGQKVDFSNIKRLQIEFGQLLSSRKTSNNIDVFGIGFVKQNTPLKGVAVFSTIPKISLVKGKEKSSIQTKPVQKKKESPKPKPIISQKQITKAQSPPTPENIGFLGTYPAYYDVLGFFVLTFLFFLVYFAQLKIRKRWNHLGQFKRILYEIHWPGFKSDQLLDVLEEQRFWRSQKEKGITQAFLSPTKGSLKKDQDEEFFGENFLIQQINAASSEGVQVIPSLCFVRSVFDYDSFMNRPYLYLSKPVPSQEIHLSDEELRVRYIGYFPIWVSPFAQKYHGLTQRLLVSYGKLPGSIFTTDSVQYNLTSPQLRKSVIRVLKKLAEKSSAVRIEGASAMLDSSLQLYWNGQLNHKPDDKRPEFWAEVIEAVKAEHPKFKFIADGVGLDEAAIHNVGFDLFENDLLKERLINQIKLETTGRLGAVLANFNKDLLRSSLYNVTSIGHTLTRTAAPSIQNQLCSALIALLPGKVIIDEAAWSEYKTFLKRVSKWPAIQSGDFGILECDSPRVFAFARWLGRDLVIVVSNLSKIPQQVNLKLDSLSTGFDAKKLYLFNDLSYGDQILDDIKDDMSNEPATAISGRDILESGLPLRLSGLSLKVISVNLTRPVSLVKKGEKNAIRP